MKGKPAMSRSSLRSSVLRLGRELGVPSWRPELRLAAELAEAIDAMDGRTRALMLGQTSAQLLKALAAVNGLATQVPGGAAPGDGRGLDDAELAAFLESL